MSNKIKILLSDQEISELRLSAVSEKEIVVSLFIESELPLNLSVDGEFIKISKHELKEGMEKLELTLTPPAEFKRLDGAISFKKGSEKLLSLPVSLTKRVEEKHKADTVKIPENEIHSYLCKRCGATLPDKRPYCAKCRKELEQTQDQISKKDQILNFLKALPKKKEFPAIIVVAVIVLLFLTIIVPLAIKNSKAPAFGSLVIKSDPPGADVVSLDEKFVRGKTPLKITDLPVGIYKFSVSMPNCGKGNEINSIEVKRNREAVFETVLPKQGSISVESYPEGASISLNGLIYDRKTPAEIKGVDIGKYKLTLTFDSGKVKNIPIEVFWGKETKLTLMEDEMSGLKLKIPEDIKIKCDGQVVGYSPIPILVLHPGRHSISLSGDTIMDWESKVDLKAGDVATLNPALIAMGKFSIKADRDADLYVNDKYTGTLPLDIYVEPSKKVVLEVATRDGATWKNGYVMHPGQYRFLNITLPPPPPPPVYEGYSSYAAPAYTPPEPATDFSDFNMKARFPSPEWRKLEQIMNDIDQDGESEMILALQHVTERLGSGYAIKLFIIKKHDGAFFDVIPLRNPKLNGIGEGELISMDVVKSDKYGYREILFATGTPRGIGYRGSFRINKNQVYYPQFIENN